MLAFKAERLEDTRIVYCFTCSGVFVSVLLTQTLVAVDVLFFLICFYNLLVKHVMALQVFVRKNRYSI